MLPLGHLHSAKILFCNIPHWILLELQSWSYFDIFVSYRSSLSLFGRRCCAAFGESSHYGHDFIELGVRLGRTTKMWTSPPLGFSPIQVLLLLWLNALSSSFLIIRLGGASLFTWKCPDLSSPNGLGVLSYYDRCNGIQCFDYLACYTCHDQVSSSSSTCKLK